LDFEEPLLLSRQAYAKQILGAIDDVLLPEGYRKKGQLFTAEREGVIHVVQVLKQGALSPEEFAGALYVGAFSPALARACAERNWGQYGHAVDRPTRVEDCQWDRRWPELKPFRVSTPEEADQIAQEIVRYLKESALPELARLTTAAAFHDVLYRGKNLSSQAQCYTCLRVLMEWAAAEGKSAYWFDKLLTEDFFREWSRPPARKTDITTLLSTYWKRGAPDKLA
jgi:hypothetical protein